MLLKDREKGRVREMMKIRDEITKTPNQKREK